jgi:hypothetical protein
MTSIHRYCAPALSPAPARNQQAPTTMVIWLELGSWGSKGHRRMRGLQVTGMSDRNQAAWSSSMTAASYMLLAHTAVRLHRAAQHTSAAATC